MNSIDASFLNTKEWSTNMFAYGAGDKRQVPETQLVSYEVDMVLFHTTSKGTTSRCLPKSQFPVQQKLESPVKIIYNFSSNH